MSLERVHAVAESSHDFEQRTVSLSEQRQSPWMTTTEAATYLRYSGKYALRSLYRFLERNGIPVRRRGARSILIARADLDRALKGK